MTIHQKAIELLCKRTGAAANGFHNFLRTKVFFAVDEEDGSLMPDPDRIVEELRVVPDAWRFDGGHEIHAYEVEDTSAISPEKMGRLGHLWFYADCELAPDGAPWLLRLFVADRYGLNEREIPLHEWFYLDLVHETGSRAHP